MTFLLPYSVRSHVVLTLLLFLSACSDDPTQPTPEDDDDPQAEQDEDEVRDAGRTMRDATVARDASEAPPKQDARVDVSPVDASVRIDATVPPIVDASVDASGPASHEDLGKGDGKDVIAIGDSWMNLGTVGIQQSLKKASGQPYRVYGVAGVELLNDNLFGAAIPSQYARAKREDADIKTVVMTGGGNDILMGIGGAMATIDKVGVRLTELWQEMHDDGVQDVVYVEYSRGGTNKENVEYGISKVKPACAAAPVRCHFVDSDEFIMMMLRDGIHPTNAGYDALGKAVYELMQREGLRR